MTRVIFASLVGSLVLAQAAWAAEDSEKLGRFQVIPNAMVPSSSGEAQEQAVLLDSATGQTWLIEPSDKSGPHWRQIQVMVGDRVGTLAESVEQAEKSVESTTFTAKPVTTKPSHRPGWDYDADP